MKISSSTAVLFLLILHSCHSLYVFVISCNFLSLFWKIKIVIKKYKPLRMWLPSVLTSVCQTHLCIFGQKS